jgi:KDO2-lipid IV(A) lauroyltransferase
LFEAGLNPSAFPNTVLKKKRLKLKHHLIYYSARLIIAVLLLLPFRWVSQLGRLFGRLVFVFSKREKLKTLNNLSTAYPTEMGAGERAKLAKAIWINLGQNLFEIIRWLNWTHEKIASQVSAVYGLEHFEAAVKRGKGVFVVTAHLGNWELLGGYLTTKAEGSALAQNLYDPRFDKLINWFRSEKLGAQMMIKRGLALRGILEALKKGQFILSLCDQDTGQDGVFVPFFGKPAWTQSGVARIAQKTGAALVPAFVVRGADRRFEVHVEKEIEFPQTKNREQDVMEVVRKYTEVIESYVRAYPDQWVWMHERWKTRLKTE